MVTPTFTLDSPWYHYIAVLVGLMACARLTRLLVNDDFPPSVWLRLKWEAWTHNGPWSKLATCLWCAAPYIVAADIAWALLSSLHWSWWLFNGWMAASYVVSWLVFHDEDGISQR